MGDLDLRVIPGSFGPPEPTTQTASRSVHPLYAGLTTVTDRQTDRERPRYSVCNNRPHPADAAMRPNNSNKLLLINYDAA